MSAKKEHFQRGFVPIIVLIVIVFLGLAGFWLLRPSQNLPAVKVESGPAAETQKLSLRETCLTEMKNLAKPPFRFQSQSEPVGTLQPIFKKERFQGVKNVYSCYTNFMFNRVIEGAYADMGIQYYERDRFGNQFVRAGAIAAFEKAVDLSLSQTFQKDGWQRITKSGETNGSVVVMILTKTKEGRDFFLDVTYPGASGVAFSYVLTVMEK